MTFLRVMVGGVVAGCLVFSSGSQLNDQVLRVAAETGFSTLNPFLAYSQGDLDVVTNIYPALTRPGEHGTAAPYLATAWTVSRDARTWTFTLRRGLRWTDGVPITAADVLWTYRLIMTDPAAATANGSLCANFTSVSAPGAGTVVITTRKPQVDVPDAPIPVVPEHIWKGHVQDVGTFKPATFPVVGYGPWILTGYVPGQYVTMSANRDFYLGVPRFSRLVVQYYANPDAAVSALRSGQLDEVGKTLTATQYLALARDLRHVARYASATAGWTGVEINPGARTRSGTAFGDGNPALHDQRVRKAIALAINRSALAGRVLDGLGEAGGPYLPPAFPQWAWTPPIRQGYDPALARRLLDAAGYRKGPDGTRLSLRLGIHSDLATDTQVAPYLVEWLAAVGIRLTVQAMSFAELNQTLPRGAWDLLMDGWTTGPDPSYLLSVQTCGALPSSQENAGSTDAFFCDRNYDRLYARQLTEFSQSERAQTVAGMQRILYDADVDVILYYPDTLSAVRADRVRDYCRGPTNAQGFYPAQNTFDDWRLAVPAPAAPGGSDEAAPWVLTALTAGVVAGGFALMMRRRATADQRE